MLDLLKYEVEGIIENFFPKKENKGKVQEETPVKRSYYENYSQTDAVGVYKHAGNVEDFTNYKDALNLPTTEIRTFKRK